MQEIGKKCQMLLKGHKSPAIHTQLNKIRKIEQELKQQFNKDTL
jgi:hypothetical protein